MLKSHRLQRPKSSALRSNLPSLCHRLDQDSLYPSFNLFSKPNCIGDVDRSRIKRQRANARRGPSMKVARKGAGVAVVDGKIYVMGGCSGYEINQVEVFDPNTQTWKVGPLGPHGEITYGKWSKWNQFREAVALDGKVYGMSFREGYHTIYDTKDGTCENLEISDEYTERIWKACVINSLIYVFYHDIGLMWYDSKEKIWRMVKDLRYDVEWYRMVECNGKLALLKIDSEEKIWCAMIALDKVGVDIHGRVEWSELVVNFHPYAKCLGLSL